MIFSYEFKLRHSVAKVEQNINVIFEIMTPTKVLYFDDFPNSFFNI